MKEISIKDIEGIRIGSAENFEGGTGVTVIICEDGAAAGLDIRGGGPAVRDSQLLNPLTNASEIHAVLLGGGSAFGLNATGGVQHYLEDREIGYDTGSAIVPLVCQADIYDLGVGDPSCRPDERMGYQACLNSEKDNYKDGCFGVGTGATVGKFFGLDRCMKSGVGSYAVQIGDLKIGALVVVNAFGDIFDCCGKQIAGVRSEDGKALRNTAELMYANINMGGNKFTAGSEDSIIDNENKFAGNTTLGVIITNAGFEKSRLCKIAGMTHNGYARSIKPVHTSADGDAIFALSVGEVEADIDVVGTLASDVMSKAIERAILSAEAAYGLPAARDL